MQVDRMNLIESKNSPQTAEKLMSILNAAPNQQASMVAVLQSINEGVGKFWVNGLGHLDIPIESQIKLAEQAKVTINFGLMDGKITADLVQFEGVLDEATSEKPMTSSNILKQLGLPPTDQNLKAVALLTEYHIEPSAERIKQLAEGSFLASKVNEFASKDGFSEAMLTENQQVDWSKTLKGVIVDWLSRSNSIPKGVNEQQLAQGLSEVIQAESNETAEVAVHLNENSAKLSESNEEAGIRKSEEVKTQVASLLDDGVETAENAVKKAAVDSLKNVLQNLNPKTLLPLVASDLAVNLENLHRSDQVFNGTKNIAQLKQMLVEQMLDVFSKIEPDQALKSEILQWLEDDSSEFIMGKQLESLEQIIGKHSPEAAEQLKDNFEQINRAINLVDQLSSQMLAMHLPIRLGDYDTQVELYVNKRRSKSSQEEFRLLIALNTNTVGQVQVLVTDKKNQIEIQFRLEDEEIKEIFEAEKAAFDELIEAFKIKPVKINFGCHFKEPPVLEAFKALNSDTTAGIDVRV